MCVLTGVIFTANGITKKRGVEMSIRRITHCAPALNCRKTTFDICNHQLMILKLDNHMANSDKFQLA